METRTHRGDGAMGHALELVALVGVFAIALSLALNGTPGPTDASGKLEQRKQVRDQLHNAVDVTSNWCCAKDPSAGSKLQDASLQAWAGDEERIEQLLSPWFTDNAIRNVRLGMAWDPHDDEPLLHLETYEERPHEGETVGLQRWTKLAQRGPAHVVPRLENVTQGGGLDLHYIPVTKWWPYTQGPNGEHATWLETEVEYTKTDQVTVDSRTIDREGHTELSSAPRPAIDLSFRELPWEQIENDDLPVAPEEANREYRQVLTKEALNAERAEKLDEPGDTYPQHRFEVNVTVKGPGAVGEATRSASYDEDDTVELENVYRITASVPPGWTDVDFAGDDVKDNQGDDWTNLTVEERPSGGWEVTALLDLNATYKAAYADEAGQPPRFVLEGADELSRSFFFHARPPAESEHPDLAFHEVTAAFESTTWRAHERDRIVVELPTDPGRVHRSVRTHVPTVVPDTDAAASASGGLRMTMGATLLNGGESVSVRNVSWSAPEGTFRAGPSSTDDIRTRAGTGEQDPADWGVSADGSTAWWDPSSSEDVCGQLDACSVAADFVVDGRNASGASPWEPARAIGLYRTGDVQPYLDWFVRSTRAVDGVRLDFADTPGFAMAHRTEDVDAGTVPGGYLWHLSPSSTPMCSEDERDARDQAEAERSGDRRTFEMGPREDGLAVVGDRLDGEDPCTAEAGFEPEMAVVARSGDRWETDAVGKTHYRALDALPQDTFTEWRNGLAESGVEANDTLAAGDEMTVTVDLDNLYDVLNEQGVTDVTVRVRVQDPYNAWEQLPWYEATIAKNGEPETVDTPKGVECPTIDPSAQPGGLECRPLHFEKDDGDGSVPSRMNISVPTPQRLVPGTHAVVLAVSWDTQVLDGGAAVSVEQTGRLIAPTDVTLPGGSRGQPTLIEGLAWLEDWR